MFKILLVCTILGLATASPLSLGALKSALVGGGRAHHSAGSSDDVHAEVLGRSDDVRADGFDATLETSNSISQSASGDVHGNIHGQFGWVSPEGVHVALSYVADENGYQPSSDLLPTPPPVPAEIVRALAYLAAHPAAA
ncbi:Lcp4 [Drosophila busckii]|uniref:Lcp4 n=1 Tax=Drosophila busckii TaxID=30019 RepID=A0A0M5J9T1_DROBS|nr:larval cuticle protein 1 isoform X1 [Drosophila busckii]XP_033149086.1 larval cuticle protein 1 isoform X2 [Drosophila busckii]ALC40918.1 Lcp4 [Drosophila busckii]